MKKILTGLFLLFSLVGMAQYSPNASKIQYSNGVAFGTKSYVYYPDSCVVYWRYDSTLMGKYKGTPFVIGRAGSTGYFIRNQYGSTLTVDNGKIGISDTIFTGGTIIGSIAQIGGTSFGGAAPFLGVVASSTQPAIYVTHSGTGDLLKLTYIGTQKFKVDISGNTTGNSFIKSGGTSSQFLMADGSVSTSAILASDTSAMLSNYRRKTTLIENSDLRNSSLTVTAGSGMSGGGSVSLGGSVTLTNAGVTSITGTANQVNASASTGSITLSLPQSIGTSSNVTFANISGTWTGATIGVSKGGTGSTSYTTGSVPYYDGSVLNQDNSKFFYDGSNHKLGIGNAVPNSFTSYSQITVGSGTGNNGMTIYSGSTSSGLLEFAKGTSGSQQYNGYFQYNHNTDVLSFGVAANDRFTLSSTAAAFTTTVTTAGDIKAYAAKSSNYTLTGNDNYIKVTASATITLPTAVGRAGQIYSVCNMYSGNITINTTSSQTFVNYDGGAVTMNLPTTHTITFASDGANWMVISTYVGTI
jgi:hypothetical protein